MDYDDKESVNLIKNKPEVARRMSERLQLFLKSRARFEQKFDQPPLTDQEIKTLKSLGYISD
jgi:hypothetical protein